MPKRKQSLTSRTADRYVLYENAVQGIEGQIDFLSGIFRRRRGRVPQTFREDFCGTAALSCEWVKRSGSNHAWGIDLDKTTLDWCRANNLPRIGEAAERVHLLREDVLSVKTPPVDLVGAFNFSFNIFKDRNVLRDYFAAVYKSLAKDGMFVLDEFGGSEGHATTKDKRKIKDGVAQDGTPLEAYTYIWDQTNYNPLTHEICCHIHFAFKDGTRMKRAFTYDWRLWTVPELRDLLAEVGFRNIDVYLEGWNDDDDEGDGVFRRRTQYDGWEAWYGYILAEK